LVDADNLEESWKLKRNKALLADSIGKHLDTMHPEAMKNLHLEFHWRGEVYETFADALFIVV